MYLSKGGWHVSGEENYTVTVAATFTIHGFVFFVKVCAGKTELCSSDGVLS